MITSLQHLSCSSVLRYLRIRAQQDPCSPFEFVVYHLNNSSSYSSESILHLRSVTSLLASDFSSGASTYMVGLKTQISREKKTPTQSVPCNRFHASKTRNLNGLESERTDKVG